MTPIGFLKTKYDGFRALAYIENGSVLLVSRKRNVYKSFTGLCRVLADCLPVHDAVLDGEIVYLDGDGKPQFMQLLHRRSPQQFVAFDLLWLDGEDLTKMPLIERKRILRSVVPVSAPVLYADYIDAEGRALYRGVCEMDLEGIVAKRKDGLYTAEATT